MVNGLGSLAELHTRAKAVYTGISETVASATQSLFHEFSLVPLQESTNLVPQIHIYCDIQNPRAPTVREATVPSHRQDQAFKDGKHQMPKRSLPIRRDILPSNARLGCPVVAINRSKTELFNSTRLDCKISISDITDI